MKLKAMNDGELMTEDVDLNYADDYIEINIPPFEDKTSATIMHHVPEVKFNFLSILCCNVRQCGMATIEMYIWIISRAGHSTDRLVIVSCLLMDLYFLLVRMIG